MANSAYNPGAMPSNLELTPSSSAQSSIKLYEDSDNGSNSIIIQPPAAITADTTLTLPDGAGSANQVLTTNGSGTLSWTTPGGGKIVQVKQAVLTSTASTTSSSFAATGLTASITPSNAANDIKVTVMLSVGDHDGSGSHVLVDLMRNAATSILQGDSGTGVQCSGGSDGGWNGQGVTSIIITYVDSPATTSSTSYDVYFARRSGGSQTCYINRTQAGGSGDPLAASVIILEEISGGLD